MMIGGALVARFASNNLLAQIANKFYIWNEPEDFQEEESNKKQVVNLDLEKSDLANKDKQ